jgi:hypothetical protein
MGSVISEDRKRPGLRDRTICHAAYASQVASRHGRRRRRTFGFGARSLSALLLFSPERLKTNVFFTLTDIVFITLHTTKEFICFTDGETLML